MNCREFADFMADYLTGDLPTDSRAAFDRHVAACPNCRTYLANYQATAELGRRAFSGDEDLPADVPEGLVKAILASRKP